MARTKVQWRAAIGGGAAPDGRSVEFPIRLANDPDRIVRVKIPRSQVDRFVKSIERAKEKSYALDSAEENGGLKKTA